jgi:hypothetical protein
LGLFEGFAYLPDLVSLCLASGILQVDQPGSGFFKNTMAATLTLGESEPLQQMAEVVMPHIGVTLTFQHLREGLFPIPHAPSLKTQPLGLASAYFPSAIFRSTELTGNGFFGVDWQGRGMRQIPIHTLRHPLTSRVDARVPVLEANIWACLGWGGCHTPSLEKQPDRPLSSFWVKGLNRAVESRLSISGFRGLGLPAGVSRL